ncbi:MAG: Uncharacterised protein [Synechococcus sp. MIT S9220]|nr:MAG: Uncharacterised protein [Synechococcus sp. MIT S9220]
MLISERLPVRGIQRDVLGCSLERCAEAEQTSVRAPASTLLRLFTQVAQVRNSLLTKSLRIFAAVHDHINQTVQSLVADDRKGFAEFLERADAASKEMAVGQFHHPAVDKRTVKLIPVFLASAQRADEFPH